MICTSRREESSIRDLGYTVPTWIIPIGIDADDLTGARRTQLRPVVPGIGVDASLVTFLGRILSKKGVPLLVESFRIQRQHSRAPT